MSTIENTQAVWSVTDTPLSSKYEKCLNITEEIYKRIDITFQVKKLEATSDVSDNSDQIDSNDLSNETDLFACDKSDITSSEEAEKGPTCEKYININNNEETKSRVVYKRPRKRFRKRVKKRQNKSLIETDGSSDEAVPLSRIVDVDTKCASESPDNVMGVPNIVILTKDLKPKTQSPENKKKNSNESTKRSKTSSKDKIDSSTDVSAQECGGSSIVKVEKLDPGMKICLNCNLKFRSDRALKQHEKSCQAGASSNVIMAKSGKK